MSRFAWAIVAALIATSAAAQTTQQPGPAPIPPSSASAPPSGAAGGDLGGTYPNPTALKTNGVVFGTSATVNTGTSGATIPLLNAANTWSAIQTLHGATTTSPGWYAQLTGDTVPRIRVGLNVNDVASIGFGSGSATRDLFLERLGAASLRLGASDAAAPVAQTLSVQSVVAGTSNTAGVPWIFVGSAGTGTGIGGAIIFQTAPAGTTGIAQNAPVTALTLDSSQNATFAGSLSFSAGSATLGANKLITWLGRGILTSAAAGNIQIGSTDTGATVAQTLSAQSVAAGATNTAGLNFTIRGSRGTGTGAGGSIILQTAPAGTTGTAQNAAVTALTIDSTGEATFAAPIRRMGYIVSALPASPGAGAMAYVTDATACTFQGAVIGGASTFCPVIYNGSAWVGG